MLLLGGRGNRGGGTEEGERGPYSGIVGDGFGDEGVEEVGELLGGWWHL